MAYSTVGLSIELTSARDPAVRNTHFRGGASHAQVVHTGGGVVAVREALNREVVGVLQSFLGMGVLAGARWMRESVIALERLQRVVARRTCTRHVVHRCMIEAVNGTGHAGYGIRVASAASAGGQSHGQEEEEREEVLTG